VITRVAQSEQVSTKVPRGLTTWRLHYYQTIGSFLQERIRWNAYSTEFHWESGFVQGYTHVFWAQVELDNLTSCACQLDLPPSSWQVKSSSPSSVCKLDLSPSPSASLQITWQVTAQFFFGETYIICVLAVWRQNINFFPCNSVPSK